MSFLLSLWGSKLGRAGLIAIAVLAIVGWVYLQGKAAGREAGRHEQAEDDRKQMESERIEFGKTMQEQQALLDRSQALLVQAESRISQAERNLQAAIFARQDARATVETIADDKLFLDITTKLNLRHPTDTRAQFYPTELRAIDLTVTDYPHLREENQALGAKIDGLEEKVAAIEGKLDAVAGQRDAAVEWGDKLLGHYRVAYNSIGLRKRSAKCLWVWKCTDKKMAVPNPVNLTRTEDQ